MIDLSPRDLLELYWLAGQTEPVWGGHLMRHEPLPDGSLKLWLAAGLIEQRPSGYVITKKGREEAARYAQPVRERCPTCNGTGYI